MDGQIAMRVGYLLTLYVCCIQTTLSASTLFYDAPAGELFLDATTLDDQPFAGFEIKSKDGKFLPDNYRRLGGATDLFLIGESTIVEGGALVGGYAPGLYGLGAIYPANIAASDFLSDVTGVTAILGEITTERLGVQLGRPQGVPRNETGIEQVDQWATNVTLSYYPNSGELRFSNEGPTGGFITVLHVEGDFVTEDAQTLDVGNRYSLTEARMESFGLIPAGDYPLGPIMTPGLSEEEFRDSIRSALFVAESGIGVASIQLDVQGSQMSLAYIPEPAGSALLMLAFLPLILLRRRGR